MVGIRRNQVAIRLLVASLTRSSILLVDRGLEDSSLTDEIKEQVGRVESSIVELITEQLQKGIDYDQSVPDVKQG